MCIEQHCMGQIFSFKTVKAKRMVRASNGHSRCMYTEQQSQRTSGSAVPAANRSIHTRDLPPQAQLAVGQKGRLGRLGKPQSLRESAQCSLPHQATLRQQQLDTRDVQCRSVGTLDMQRQSLHILHCSESQTMLKHTVLRSPTAGRIKCFAFAQNSNSCRKALTANMQWTFQGLTICVVPYLVC